MKKINTKVLMSGADYFDDGFAINAYMDDSVPVDVDKAKAEHRAIQACFKDVGIEVTQIAAPEGCQDGVYTANWALVVNGKAIMANLPNKRRPEEAYAEKILLNMGLDIVQLPEEYSFSGQGDALPCGEYLFVGSVYRTDAKVHSLLAQETNLKVISLQTIPQLDEKGDPVINLITGWPDSFFYDLDLALAVISNDLIAWCPEAFTTDSQFKIRNLDVNKIEVGLDEAMHGFASNLVSTGDEVIMSDRAPKLKRELERRGLKVLTPDVTELLKGGGFIRCTSLTL